jgi:DNA mismatch repair protein MutL
LIRILEDRVVNKIAAGEVVERPASVVKELLENALDAGATQIVIRLERGGRQMVEITDDGAGMARADATLCLERHATSKIRTETDLFTIDSLGFRGEAIPSIAAVSRFELQSRPSGEGTGAGTRVVVKGGRLVNIEDVGCPEGTRVQVRNIFFNIPARRKFLRTVPTELGHCIEAVVRYALVRPELDVEIVHDGRTLLRAPRVEDWSARAADLLGPHGEALVPISFEKGVVKGRALVSPVGVHKGSPQGSSYLFVNGRYVRDPVLRRGVNEAYRGIVPKGRYPTVILDLRLPPADVDVNVHPAKTEVRFQNARDTTRAITEGIREGLEAQGIKLPVPNEARYQPKGMGDWAPPPPPPMERPEPRPQAGLPWQPAPAPVRSLEEPARPYSPMAGDAQPTETNASRDLLPVAAYRDLRVLGQLALTYILCEGGGELVIIDQHAAHERIMLHRIKHNARERLGGAQRMLDPIIVELSPARARTLEPHAPELARFGLEIEPFGGHSFAIKQVPEAFAKLDLPRLLEDVADDVAQGGKGEALHDVVEYILATMACRSSVRAGQTLSPYEMRELLAQLDEVDFSVCAHGRPTSVRISPEELERRFHRT